MPIHDNLAAVRGNRTGQRLDQRGFSRPIVADHRENFARIKVEIRVIERRDPAETLDEITRLQQGLRLVLVAHAVIFRIH